MTFDKNSVVLGLFLFFFILSNSAIAKKAMSIEIFQLHQFQDQYNQLLDIYAAEGSLKTDNQISRAFDLLGVTEQQLSQFQFSLVEYAEGTYFTRGFECGKEQFDPFEADSTGGAIDDRLDLLAEFGPRIFWSSMELPAYRDAVLRNEFKADHLPAICGRVETLYNELKCLAENPSSCQGNLADKLKQEPYKSDDTNEASLIFAISTAVQPIKNHLHPFMDMLVWTLGQSDAEIREAIEQLLTSETRSFQQLDRTVRSALITAYQRNVSIAVFNAYRKLPPSVRRLVEDEGLTDVLLAANDAAALIKSYKPVSKRLTNDAGEKIESLVKKPYDQALRDAELVIEKSVDKFGTAVRRYLNDFDPIATAGSEIADILELPADQICEKLSSHTASNDWGPNMWGVPPNESAPIGFRFVFSDKASQDNAPSPDVHVYRAELQLLVYTPPSVYKTAKILNRSGNETTCSLENIASYTVLPTGISTDKVIKDINAAVSANGFVKFDKGANKGNGDIDAFKKALRKLGVLPNGISGKPGVHISADFRGVEISLPVEGVSSDPIPIIKDGKVVFDIASLGRERCKEIESVVLPSLVENWVKSVSFSISDDWSISLAQEGIASLSLPGCDSFYPQVDASLPPLEQLPKPLSSDKLAIAAIVALKGKIGDKPFSWPANANIELVDDKLTLKSLGLGDTPKAVKDAVDSIFANTRSSWAIVDQGDLSFYVATGTLALEPDMSSASLPVFINVASSTCAPQSITASIGLPDGNFRFDSGSIETAVQNTAVCSAQRKLNEYISETFLTCDKISGDFFGLKSVQVIVDEAKSVDGLCHFDIDGTLAQESVSIKDVKAYTLPDGGGYKFEFDSATVDSSMVKALENEIDGAIGAMAKSGVLIDNPRFGKNAFLFELAFTLPDPVGTIDVGTVALSADGKVNIESEFERILANRVSAYITPKLNAIIESVAPDFIYDPKIRPIAYSKGKLDVVAEFKLEVHPDLPKVPGTLQILPSLKASIDLNEDSLRAVLKDELDNFMFSQLPLKAPPVEAQLKDYYLTPSYEVTLVVGVKVGLDALGEIDVESVYISEKGVDFGGRIELRVGFPIYLVPAPVPVVLTRPGIFYDFDAETVGALGALTVIAPSADKLLQIDVVLGIGDPNKFITELTLEGDLIFLNTLPVLMTEGKLDFKRTQITFEGETSELFKALMDARMRGDFKPRPGTASLTSSVGLFGAKLLEAEFTADIRKCPRRCIKGGAEVNLVIGTGKVGAEFGPLLVDALLQMTIDLEIFGKNYGGVRVEAEALRAHLEGKILKVLKLSIRTPSLEELSPEYIAEVIASLLEVDLKDVKNPKIEIAPAGPQSDSGDGNKNGSDGGGQDDGGGDEGEEDRGGVLCCNPPVPPPIKETPSPIPPIFDIPQRFPSQDGRSLMACRKEGKSWGYLTYYKQSNWWSYSSRMAGIPDDVFNKVCKPHGTGKGPWNDTGAFAIVDDWHPLYTYTSKRKLRGETECTLNGNAKECTEGFPIYRTRYYQSKSEPRTESHPFVLHYDGREYTSETAAEIRTDNEVIKLGPEMAAELAELPVTDRYLQKILREKLQSQESIRTQLITRFEETEKSAERHAEKEEMEREGRKPGFFSRLFTSDKRTFNVEYQIVRGGKSASCRERAYILTNKAGEFLLSHYCEPPVRWVYEPLSSQSSSAYRYRTKRMVMEAPSHFKRMMANSANNNRAKDILINKASIAIDPTNKTVISQDKAHWLLNNGIPSLLDGREIKALGQPIAPDPVLSKCQSGTSVSSILMSDNRDYLAIDTTKVSTPDDDRTVFTVSQFRIDKRGTHERWIDSGNPNHMKSMASFLSCQNNPEEWLSEHRMWLDPIGNTLLFYPVDLGDSLYVPVQQFQPNIPVRTIEVPRIDPYSLTTPTDQVKKRFYEKAKAPGVSRLTVVHNTDSLWEAQMLEHANGYIDFHLIDTICNAPFNQSKWDECQLVLPINDLAVDQVRADMKKFRLNSDVLRSCFKEMELPQTSIDPTGVIGYLNIERAVSEVGHGPHNLFRELTASDTSSCQPRP